MRVTRIAFLALAAVIPGKSADTRILDAVKSMDKAQAQALIRQKADVNGVDRDGTGALLLAAHANDVELIQSLLAAGANVNYANRYGVAPINEAAATGSAALVGALLKAGANPNAATGEGETALMAASRSGNADAVKALLDKGAEVNAKETWRGQTALMWAALENHPEVIRILLAKGAKSNEVSKITIPPGRGGRGPGNPQGGLTPLGFAARNGSLEAAKALVEGGANVNQASADNSTPLLISILNAHFDITGYLLGHKADPNIANAIGEAPLFAAVYMRNLEHSARPAPPQLTRENSMAIIEALLARGADVNVRLTRDVPPRGGFEFSWATLDGATPFIRAAKSSDLSVMKLLVQHGADPNIATVEKTTALMFAAGVSWEDFQSLGTDPESIAVMKYCIEKGADVNAVNDRGQVALHGAAIRGSTAVIKYLADNGAKVNVKDKIGRTPLTYAQGVHISAGSPTRQDAAVKLFEERLAARGEKDAAEKGVSLE
jgi:uncharacterized protein